MQLQPLLRLFQKFGNVNTNRIFLNGKGFRCNATTRLKDDDGVAMEYVYFNTNKFKLELEKLFVRSNVKSFSYQVDSNNELLFTLHIDDFTVLLNLDVFQSSPFFYTDELINAFAFLTSLASKNALQEVIEASMSTNNDCIDEFKL